MAGLVGMGGLAYFVVDAALRRGEDAVRKEFSAWANLSAKAVAGQFTARYLDVQEFASNVVFQGGNRETFVRILNEYIERYKVYDAIVVVDGNGRFFASNTKAFDGRSLDTKTLEGRVFSDAPWFQRALKGEYFEDSGRGLTGSVVEDFQSDPLTSALYGQPHSGMSFSRSIVSSDGKLLGVLTARASLRFIEAQLRESYNTLAASGRESGDVVALNRDGVLLAEVSKGAMAGKSDTAESKVKILRWNLATQQGQRAAREAVAGNSGALIEQDYISRAERIWGYQRVQDRQFVDQLGWSILVSAPTDEVFAQILWQRRALLIGFAIVSVLTGLVAMGMVHRISYNFRDESLKIRDESLRMSELIDSLSAVVRKFYHLMGQKSTGPDSPLSSFSRNLLQLNDCINTLGSVSGRTRDIVLKTEEDSARICQSVVVDGYSDRARSSVNELTKVFSDIDRSLESLSDVFFRLDLIEHNAEIQKWQTNLDSPVFENIVDELSQVSGIARDICQKTQALVTQARRHFGEISSATQQERSASKLNVNRSVELTQHATKEFSCLADLFEGTRASLTERMAEMTEALQGMKADSALDAQRLEIGTEMESNALSLQEQATRIEALMSALSRELMVRVGRARARKEVLPVESTPASGGIGLFVEEKSRAEAVDRLAQKMRPRLVVDSHHDEPEVSEIFQDDTSSRKAG
ncbi:MAG: hypothetical protein RIR26_155 [Pseudomonadota bacterium]